MTLGASVVSFVAPGANQPYPTAVPSGGVTERRTAYPAPVLEAVQTEAREAEGRLSEALARLEKETLEDPQRADWEHVPALETDDGHETPSDAQLRGALYEARDSLAEVEDLLAHLLEGEDA